MCGGVPAEPSSSACISVFWFSQDKSECVGEFLPANESMKVKLRVEKTLLEDAIQTGENCGCGRSSNEKEM